MEANVMDHPKDFDSESVLNAIYNGLVAIDIEGSITYFNKTAERLFRIPAHEAINRYILSVLPITGGKLLESLKTGTPFYGEKLKEDKVTLISNISPIVCNGKISAVVSVFQDISEIEKISRELDLYKNMKEWLDTIIDSSYDGFWICDPHGKVVRINKAAEKINDLKAETVVGKNVKDLVREGIYDKVVTFEVLKKRASVTVIQKTMSGKRLLITGNPIFDEKRNIAFVVINERDITALDNLRGQLEETQSLARGYMSKLSELEIKRVDLSNIVFRSEHMQRVIEIAIRVAHTDSAVLLLGESGVGKGAIARLIQKHSNRKNGPFIQVDCAGIPESLIETELFGYERGAFTGARTEGKAGFFELANNGTLFLDEIGEITLSSQSKLLRFLDDHEVIRVGGTAPREIDLRVITATNKNIEEMMSAKLFREDLYYRLNVVPIHILPLRERPDDILPLTCYYLEKFNASYQKKKIFSEEALEALCKYNFPGNIRELANLIERLVVITDGELIRERDVSNRVVDYPAKTPIDRFLWEGLPLREAMRKCESLMIERARRKYGSQRETAKILGVDQATISRKIRKYLLQ
jgi:PAS domain S-box-containing protein